MSGLPLEGRAPYLAAAATLLAESGCTIRHWRSNSTGVAFTNADDWGIEVPQPRGAISYGIFAHEVAHQMLHRHGSRPRWLEEIEAWEWALQTFERFSLPGLAACQGDAARCLSYAARKAIRRSRTDDLAAVLMSRMLRRYPSWALAPLLRVIETRDA